MPPPATHAWMDITRIPTTNALELVTLSATPTARFAPLRTLAPPAMMDIGRTQPPMSAQVNTCILEIKK